MGNYADCRACHDGIETMDEDHDFSCATCHLRPENRNTVLPDHRWIIRHPASPDHVELFCSKCHRKEIDRLKNSLHWTLAGMISQTRFLWGAQPDPHPRYSAAPSDGFKRLPDGPISIKTPADLVDDLLSRRCFSCHLGSPPPPKKGIFRGLGCAACHVPYTDNGRYHGEDNALKGKSGYPILHSFIQPIPTEQCLHCHNGPYIGADYVGMFQHDFHQSYRAPLIKGTLPPQTYLMDHHLLKSDVHFEKGLLCVDCHNSGDVMGRGVSTAGSKDAVAVRCQSCHTDETAVGNSSFTTLKSRIGRRRRVPTRDPSIPAHAISGMEKVHCLGCHAVWGFMDYGPSLIRDDREDLTRWAPWRLQGDASVDELFDVHGRFLGKKDASLPGPWLLGWRFRRWEYLTLGKDDKGRIVPFRPRYQYQISYVDKTGRVVLDSVVPTRGDGNGRGWAYMPYYPHTVQKRGRSCEACHAQPLAVGNGLWEGFGPDLMLTQPSQPVYPSMMLLTETEKQKLLNKTALYRKWRFKTLWWDYLDQENSNQQ